MELSLDVAIVMIMFCHLIQHDYDYDYQSYVLGIAVRVQGNFTPTAVLDSGNSSDGNSD